MTPAFWRGKRVLVTGHTGFKGSWLVLLLRHLGAEVGGFALAPATTPSLFEKAGVADGIASLTGDVRDLAGVRAAIDGFAPEIVLHLAAQPLVRLSYEQPVETFGTNVMGTVHVLEAARTNPGVRVIVNVTSDKCYENQGWVWGYRENEAMGGHDPYSASKGCSELVTASYIRSFGTQPGAPVIASGRAGNVIGGGDWAADRLVPDIVRAFLRGEPVAIRNPAAVRPWQHVLEPLSGYLVLAEHLFRDGPQFSGGWNFGPAADSAQPAARVADLIRAHWPGAPDWQDASEPGAVHEAHFLHLDSTKARSLLGWAPRWPLDRALKQTVDWYRSVHASGNARAMCQAQIEAYLAS